jgi:hypothetical protein
MEPINTLRGQNAALLKHELHVRLCFIELKSKKYLTWYKSLQAYCVFADLPIS